MTDCLKRWARTIDLLETCEPDEASTRNFSPEKYPCSKKSILYRLSLCNLIQRHNETLNR